MKVHISLNVADIKKSVDFYRRMLGSEPAKYITASDSENGDATANAEMPHPEQKKSGYAKFDIQNPPLNLALNEVQFNAGGSLSHLGLQVGTTKDVLDYKEKWIEEGLITVDEMGVDCCYAKQDKTWVRDPDGNEWEAFTVLENLDPADGKGSCECSEKVSEYVDSVKSKLPVSCC